MLFEKNYTGIPVVNLEIVKYFLKEYPQNVHFFYGEYIVNTQIVKEVIIKRTGQYLIDKLKNNVKNFYTDDVSTFIQNITKENPTQKLIGIFSFFRTQDKKYFDEDFQIFHDLTPLVTQEFHGKDVISHIGLSLKLDAFKTDNLVCISESTKEDMITYLGVDTKNLYVSTEGSEYHKYYNDQLKIVSKLGQSFTPKKFIYVLGTIEPRKNISIIFKYLNKYYKENDYTFIFTGRNGWGLSFSECLKASLDRENYQTILKKIKFLGYVSEQDKIYLLKNSLFTIYPSLYEGFGLPILESISVGTPCLTTYSTSMPEICEDKGYYFDPFDEDDLRSKIIRLEQDIKDNPCLGQTMFEISKKFTWERFCKTAFKLG